MRDLNAACNGGFTSFGDSVTATRVGGEIKTLLLQVLMCVLYRCFTLGNLLVQK